MGDFKKMKKKRTRAGRLANLTKEVSDKISGIKRITKVE